MTSSVLRDFLLFFLESSNLQRDPQDTLTERLITLRILYSLRNIDVPRLVEQLEESGFEVGEFDAEHLVHVHEKQMLTKMDAACWAALLRCLQCDSIDSIVRDLCAHYAEEVYTRSAFMNLRTLVQEALDEADDILGILVHVFLIVFSKEYSKDAVLAYLLPSNMKHAQKQQIGLRIFAQHMAEVSPADLEHDLFVIMQYTQVKTTEDVPCLSAVRAGGAPTGIIQGALVQGEFSRFSLLKLRKNITLQAQHVGASDKGASWRPACMPLVPELWDTLSIVQQQLLILVASLQTAVCNRDELVLAVYPGHCQRTHSFQHCVISQSDHERATSVITSLLFRIALTVDPSKSEVTSNVEDFVESCFESSMGITQRKSMSSTLKTQFFVCAYLVNKVQQSVFTNVAKSFNERAFRDKESMYIPDTLNSHLRACMQKWVSERDFPLSVMLEVFKPLCL